MKGTEKNRRRDETDTLETLFRHAAAREKPPASDEQAIRAALHAEWSGMTARRKRRNWVLSLAAAASVALAAFLGFSLVNGPEPITPARQLATIEKIVGTAFLKTTGDTLLTRLNTAETLDTGQVVTTRSGARLAIRWLAGASVRLDQNSEIHLTAQGGIKLVSGRIYIDTEGTEESAEALTILTPAGAVSHLGTQYMTAVSGAGTTISVREGRAVLLHEDVAIDASRGEQLRVDTSGVQSRKIIPTYGPLWQWAGEVSPGWISDGRSIADFLQWVARESGRSIRYVTPQAEELAAETILHGDVTMEPMQALTAMLQASDLVPEISNGTIMVRGRFEP